MRARTLFTSLVVAIAAARVEAAEDVMRLHFIDVGQGDATLVELPCAALLIDTGGERFPAEGKAIFDSTRVLTSYLAAFFEARPDLGGRLAELILTHPHPDHTRGVSQVVKRFRPANIVHDGLASGIGGAFQADALDAIQEKQAAGWFVLQRRITDAQSGLTNSVIDPVTCAGTHTADPRIRALWGQVTERSGWDEQAFDNPNNHSVVTRIDYGRASVLFTGDLEERNRGVAGARAGGIERMLAFYRGSALLDVDVYHVGHHGSHNGTSRDLVAAMSPQIAVISAGPPCKRAGFSAWSHGHPRVETIRELESGVSGSAPRTISAFSGPAAPTELAITKAIYATSWDGTIVLEAKPSGEWKLVSRSGAQACPS